MGVGRGRSGGADFDGVVGEVGEVAGGHLGAAGVVDADEQDAGLVGHGVPFLVVDRAVAVFAISNNRI